MTPQNLLDYVKVYDNFFDEDFCKVVVSQLDKDPWNKHSYNDPIANENITYDDDLSIHAIHDTIEKQKVNKKVWDALYKYIVEDNPPFQKWFGAWSGYTGVRFNRYDVNTNMKIHCDHIHTIFDGNLKGVPILTVLGSLNNDYIGGEFLMFGDYEIKLKTGSVIVFPSNFLYPHQVNSVKSGVRYSFVSWAW
jgi:predicted 2-oxoglutarate/Fe(II)-dependent dioxygenase YbiX